MTRSAEQDGRMHRMGYFSMVLFFILTFFQSYGYANPLNASGKFGLSAFVSMPISGIGFSAYSMREKKIGLYGDVRVSVHPMSAPKEIGGSVGITVALSNSLVVYVAGGVEHQRHSVGLGPYMLNRNETKTVPDLVTGVIVYPKNKSRFGVRVGCHTASPSIEIGFAMRFYSVSTSPRF